MNVVHKESFSVVGRSARTTNAVEMNGRGIIAGLWSLTDSAALPIIAVYSHYESDRNGPYGYTLGRVADADATSTRGLARCRVEAGDYLVIEISGPITPETVVGLWQRVWQMEDRNEIARAYRTDFEVYSNGGMELNVGILR